MNMIGAWRLLRIVRIRHQVRAVVIGGNPLGRTGGALGFLPIEAEQVIQVIVRPGVGLAVQAPSRPLVIVSSALPLPHLFFQPKPCSSIAGGGRLGADAFGRSMGAMRLAKGVPAGDERHGLFVVHRHAAKGLTNILGGRERIGIAVRPFRIDIDQAHLHGGQRLFQFPSPL